MPRTAILPLLGISGIAEGQDRGPDLPANRRRLKFGHEDQSRCCPLPTELDEEVASMLVP